MNKFEKEIVDRKKAQGIDVKIFEFGRYYSRPNGRSFYNCMCPFCGQEIYVYAWSAFKGKKCECGALLKRGVGREPDRAERPTTKGDNNEETR